MKKINLVKVSICLLLAMLIQSSQVYAMEEVPVGVQIQLMVKEQERA